MKICLFTENQYKGGLDTFLINLINAWPNSNDEITLLCNKSHPGLETITSKVYKPFNKNFYDRFYPNIFVKLSNDKNKSSFYKIFLVRAFLIIMYQLLQYPVLFPWYIITLIIFFKRSDFDRLIVVNGGHPASLLCRCAVIAWKFSGKKTKAILNFHNYPMTPRWFFRVPEYLIDVLVLYSCSYIVGVSKDCINSLKQRPPFLLSKKIIYIHNGIEDPLLNINIKDKERKIYQKDSMHCLMLATYEKRKGHNYLLQAFKIVEKEIPNVFLKIYGYGTKKEFDIVINIQGDEPFINPEQILQVAKLFEHEKTAITTIAKQIKTADELLDENTVKVVFDENHFALNFSRLPIPQPKSFDTEKWFVLNKFYKHIGIYGYRTKVLQEICKLQPTKKEISEKLEQLRWLENGYKIKVGITAIESISIDVPKDIEKLNL